MNQIQKLLCYSGLEVQDYRDCQPEIEEENRRKMHVYLNMACGLLFAITCLSGGIGVLREHSLLYCIALVVCAGLRVVDLMFPDQNGLLLRWLMYAFAAMLYALGIAEAVHAPGRAFCHLHCIFAGGATAVHDAAHPAHCQCASV